MREEMCLAKPTKQSTGCSRGLRLLEAEKAGKVWRLKASFLSTILAAHEVIDCVRETLFRSMRLSWVSS